MYIPIIHSNKYSSLDDFVYLMNENWVDEENLIIKTQDGSYDNSTAEYTCATRYKTKLQRLAPGSGHANVDEQS